MTEALSPAAEDRDSGAGPEFAAQADAVDRKTRELVRRAADAMLRAGDGGKISQNTVRRAIGRGSMGTIAPALRDWWEELGKRVVNEERMPEIPDDVSALMAQLWRASLEASGSAFAMERADLAGQMARLREENAGLREKISSQETEIAESAAAREQERARLQAELDAERRASERLRGELSATGARLDAIAAERERERLAHEVALNQAREDAHLERARNAAEEKRLAAEVDKARQEATREREAGEELREKALATERALREEAARLREELGQVRAESASHQREAGEARKALSVAEGQVSRLEASLAAQEAATEQAAGAAEELRQEVAGLKGNVESLGWRLATVRARTDAVLAEVPEDLAKLSPAQAVRLRKALAALKGDLADEGVQESTKPT